MSTPWAAEVLEARQMLSVITVTSLLDNTTAGDGLITLREALIAANTNASVDGSVAGEAGVQDTIVFDGSLAGRLEMNPALGPFVISDSVRIEASGATRLVIDGRSQLRVFDILAGAGNVTFAGLSISGGKTTASGTAGAGAGIRSASAGTISLETVELSHNETTGDGACGAGLFAGAGNIAIVASTISDNSAAGANTQGGGIFATTGTVTLTNTTISGNSAREGGGIFSTSADVSLRSTTVTGNNANDGGGLSLFNASLALSNTIVAGNDASAAADDIRFTNNGGAKSATAISSLVGVNAGTPFAASPGGNTPDAQGNFIGTPAAPINAGLDILSGNGGQTRTHALLNGSIAINTGSNAQANLLGLTFDQRGAGSPRIDGTVDIGAFEVHAPNPVIVVTTADDELDADLSNPNDLSLREAIAIANSRFGHDTITFAPGLNGIPLIISLGELAIRDSLTIIGNGANNTILDAQGGSRILDGLWGAIDLTLNNLKVTQGRVAGAVEAGAAIRFLSPGHLVLRGVELSNSSVVGTQSRGAAIFANPGDVTVVDSLIAGNDVQGSFSSAAGIFSHVGAVTVTNSTISGNTAVGSTVNGAAIFTTSVSAAIHLVNSTVTANVNNGDATSRGAVVSERGSISLANSIVAGNTVTGFGEFDVTFADFNGVATFAALNSILGVNTDTPLAGTGGAAGANGNFVGTAGSPFNPNLSPLADNGGATRTPALLPASAAIDAGNTALAVDPNGVPLTTDQRRGTFLRVIDGIVDIGAFESGNSGTPITVTTLFDVADAGDGLISLREALQAANTNTSVDGSASGQAAVQDVIVFAPGLAGRLELNGNLGSFVISDSVRIIGPGAGKLIIDALKGQFRVFDVTSAAGDVAFIGMTITGGSTGSGSLNGLDVAGAGIRSQSSGTLTLQDCEVAGNVTHAADPGNGHGGGIFALNDVVVVSSTIAGNETRGRDSHGAGMYVQSGDVSLINSTISGNVTAPVNVHLGVTGDGGGIFAGSGNVTLINSTITNNAANGTTANGGGLKLMSGSLTLNNSIVAGNTASGVGPDIHFEDSLGTAAVVSSHSLIGVNTGTPFGATGSVTPDGQGNFIGSAATPIAAPLLPLANNGGPTRTHALLAGSIAVNSGDNALAVGPGGAPLAFDQRGPGSPRIDGGTVDMGSFEFHAANAPLVVTVANDEVNGNISANDLSLREAILIANSRFGADTITFAPHLNGSAIVLSLGELVITDSLTITGNGADLTVVDADEKSRVINVLTGAIDVTLNNIRITGGRVATTGEVGAGIRIIAAGTLTLNNTEVSDNQVVGVFGRGGGVYANSGDVLIVGSLLSENGVIGQSSEGGGIYSHVGAVTVINSTLSGNVVGSNGAAIYTDRSSGTITLTNSTVTKNVLTDQGTAGRRGAVVAASGFLSLRNSIVAGNSLEFLIPPSNSINEPRDIVAGVGGISAFNSIIGVNVFTPLQGSNGVADANGNFVGTAPDPGFRPPQPQPPFDPFDPLLGPLVDNGGPTRTHLPLNGSAAIDNGNNTLAVDVHGNPLTTDQRGTGFARIINGTVDIGAIDAAFSDPSNPPTG
jgi:CSLREA domain-containing protein